MAAFLINPATPKHWSLLSPACASIVLLVLGIWMIKVVVGGLRSPLRKIPGPSIAGWTNLRLKLAVITGRRIHYVHSLHEKYGPYVRISPAEISINDPQGFAHIHRINSGFTKSKWYQELAFFERPTLFTLNDTKSHAARRRMFARAFSKSYLRQNWEDAVRLKVQMVAAKIKSDAMSGTADILKWWTFMATDVSAHLMFGESFNMIERGEVNEYVRVLQLALKGGGIGAELPFIRAAFKYIPVKSFQELFCADDFLLEYAKIAVKNSKSTEGGKTIFATIMHEAEKGEHLDDLDVQLEALALLVAGSDTTAITLTYLVWAVISRPQLQAELEKEVAALPESYSDADLEDLVLLNAVIEETLRLYGAAPGGLPRIVPVVGVQMNGYFLPEGTTVTTQSYSLHRDPNLFPNPYEFDPSRWLPVKHGTQDNTVSDAAKAVFSPFGAGSRICLGIHLARMELRLAATEFFRQCHGARLATSVTPKSMELENFFLIAPAGHRCEIILDS